MAITATALKEAYPRALSRLARVLGDFDAAEEAVQEAAARAAQVWPRRGIPDQPWAWLVRTGHNWYVDQYRRKGLEQAYCQSFAPLLDQTQEAAGELTGGAYDDDLLRLMFTSCHPVLATDVQIALTLKVVAGLTLEEIASAYLTPVKTMEQRITRAKRKIREVGIPYEIPSPQELPQRLSVVLSVIYLIFNEGYKTTRGPRIMGVELCAEAIRLGQMLVDCFADSCEACGLLALMLLQYARHRARIDADGELVALDQQDRGLWDQPLIEHGQQLLLQTLGRRQPGPYQIQAAIAAVHCAASRYAATDWHEIAILYRQLEHYQPSPVVTLNRAVAVWQSTGAEAAMILLDSIAGDVDMQRYYLFHATRAELLAAMNQPMAACTAYERALLCCPNSREQNVLRGKMAALGVSVADR